MAKNNRQGRKGASPGKATEKRTSTKTRKADSKRKAVVKRKPILPEVSSLSPRGGSFAEGLWPTERQVFFRPNRLAYVRKETREEVCVFCRSANSELSEGASWETLCLYRTEHSMIVLNKYPYNSGHVLVLPRRHEGNYLGLTEEEHQDLHLVLRRAVEAVTEVYRPSAINLGMNIGATAGAGIPEHLHYHVIPRWAGDTNFFPLVAETKTVIESLETSFERLVAYLKGA